ncbi:hypothetical protein KP509_04G093800 [Ceratopteris richardii]|uniref:Mei2-like C-terminal RNA recognition motif domain-containing protein n=1 Tax=Ceratopteris richardii TaxID=49495 RepID=A0A8T2UZA1_CERRI|nr:hypothetical protein KP509_04G093800 [Ceratopteris richardii]KAH7440151.1 hypothetical protein KP509_04G093800 [Ceratopteris richardii]
MEIYKLENDEESPETIAIISNEHADRQQNQQLADTESKRGLNPNAAPFHPNTHSSCSGASDDSYIRRRLDASKEADANSSRLIYSDGMDFQQIKDVTTLMIRNIPNRLTFMDLVNFMDFYCRGNVSNSAAYDFLYLVMDFRTSLNKGYAFVNFTTSKAANVFRGSLTDLKWFGWKSKKICEISVAKVQGLDALERHFKQSVMQSYRDDFMPIAFTPPRNGYNANEVQYRVLVSRSQNWHLQKRRL